ncbi:MAG: peptidylprolyl isomerase [Polaribacter sp.]|nr:peptidylprolyl isomerase [Polaribacter sp.]
MTKIKYFILVGIVSVLIYACSGDTGNIVEFDHAAQSLEDNDSLVKYFNNHYYDSAIDSVKPLVAGKTALIDDSNLKATQVTENEVDYTLYYYLAREGTPDPVKGFPTATDSVLSIYEGKYLETTSKSVTFENGKQAIWFTLATTIRGWAHGFTNFKGGKNITNNGPITYENGGKGVLFIPSGLAYRDIAQVLSSGIIPASSSLIFYINLLDIKEDTDHDNDGVPSIYEDIDNDKNPNNDDTDDDGIPDYVDTDDDGDGVRTKDEDTNGDGDPRNDDADGDGIPNYLDSDS